MPVTIDRSIGNYHDSSNARIRKIGRAVGPVLYTVGGEPLTPAELGLGKVEAVLFEPFTNGTVIIIGMYEIAAQTLKFYDMTGAEQAAVDLSTYSARFEAIGY
jgi:hypothetical protein